MKIEIKTPDEKTARTFRAAARAQDEFFAVAAYMVDGPPDLDGKPDTIANRMHALREDAELCAKNNKGKSKARQRTPLVQKAKSSADELVKKIDAERAPGKSKAVVWDAATKAAAKRKAEAAPKLPEPARSAMPVAAAEAIEIAKTKED